VTRPFLARNKRGETKEESEKIRAMWYENREERKGIHTILTTQRKSSRKTRRGRFHPKRLPLLVTCSGKIWKRHEKE